jgi:hypothetical protein
MPSLGDLPTGLPDLPGMPSLPDLPSLPGMPSLPSMPSIPSLPATPDLSSPGGVADAARRAADAMGIAVPPEAAGLVDAARNLAGGGLPAAPDLDALYDGIVERLKRDLLAERERMGDLLGNLGH